MAKIENGGGKSKADLYREERKARLAKAAKKSASKSEKSLRIQKLVQKIVAVTLAAAILVGIGWTVLSFNGVMERTATAATVGNEKVSVRDINYYYMLMYNYSKNMSAQYQQQYGYDPTGFNASVAPDKQEYPQKNEEGETITWSDYLRDAAVDRAQQYIIVYTEAVKAGYSMTDEEKAAIDDQVEQIRTSAAKSNMSINAFLRETYGRGISERFLRKQLEKETLVQRFSEDKFNEIKESYTPEAVKKIYEEDKDSYDVVSVRSFSFAREKLKAEDKETADALAERQKAADAAVKAKADAMLAGVTDEATFVSLAKENKVVAEGADYDADAETALFFKNKAGLESTISKDAATWLFEDARKVGDKKVFETDNAYFVVYLKTTQFPTATVDVKHILLSFKADPSDSTPATDAEKSAAKKKADDVYAEWLEGEKTSDRFSELAKEYSMDTGSKENGGLYEGVYTGQMVAPFENWCFDTSRKAGDTGIVETTYGYHVMYFIKNNKTDFSYIDTITESKANEDNEKFLQDLLDSEQYKLTKNFKNINKAVDAALVLITKSVNSQS